VGAQVTIWGKHTSGRHNCFGLKGSGTDCVAQEVVNGKTITITDGGLNFPDLGACVQSLASRWYKDYQALPGVNNAVSRDAAAHELKVAGVCDESGLSREVGAVDGRVRNDRGHW